jgi:hypothetical protein
MVPVSSRSLAAVGYDPLTSEMHILFKRGGLYAYPDVPPEVHAALMDAGSKGRYFYYFIRFRFRYRRLN